MSTTPAQSSISRSGIWKSLFIFILIAVSLQYGWSNARGTAFEKAIIHTATVQTAVALVNILTPEVGAFALGSRIRAPGGGINVLNGCEGTEVLFLLISAILAYPFTWRLRLIGTLAGTALVFTLNQGRLLALFYSYRSDKELFNNLHGTIAPLVLLILTLAFFSGMLHIAQKSRPKG